MEREFPPRRVTTEREMRALDTPVGRAPVEQSRFAVPLLGGRGQLQLTPVGHPRLHFPDRVVTLEDGSSNSGMLAIELERTAKGRARLRRILSGYICSRHVGSVRYYVTNRRVHSLVQSEVLGLRAEGLVGLEMLAPNTTAVLQVTSASDPDSSRALDPRSSPGRALGDVPHHVPNG